MIPGLIPDLNALERAAETVLRSIPPALVRGEIVTGLYGMGFLGRWALPRLKAQGVRMESCHDGNAVLRGRCVDGVPVRHASELETRRPEFMVITARHAVKPVSALAGRPRHSARVLRRLGCGRELGGVSRRA